MLCQPLGVPVPWSSCPCPCTRVAAWLRPAQPSPPQLLCALELGTAWKASALFRFASLGLQHNLCSGFWFPETAAVCAFCPPEGAGGRQAVCGEHWGARESDSPPLGFPAALHKKYIYIKNIMKNKKTFSPPIILNIKRRFLSIMGERFWP